MTVAIVEKGRVPGVRELRGRRGQTFAYSGQSFAGTGGESPSIHQRRISEKKRG